MSVGGLNSSYLVFKEQRRRKLCDINAQKQNACAYVSLFRGLSLHIYLVCHRNYCNSMHTQPCARCSALSSFALHVLEHGYYCLSETYKTAFPHLQYRSQNALELFLHMPLVGVRVGTPQSGTSAWYLLEYIEGVKYFQVVHFLEATLRSRHCSVQTIGTKGPSGIGAVRSRARIDSVLCVQIIRTHSNWYKKALGPG